MIIILMALIFKFELMFEYLAFINKTKRETTTSFFYFLLVEKNMIKSDKKSFFFSLCCFSMRPKYSKTKTEVNLIK